MAGWAGFTDEDLRRMKQGPDNDSASLRQAQLKRQRPSNRERLSQNSKSRMGSAQTNMHASLDPSQRLTLPAEAKHSTSNAKQRSNTQLGASEGSKDGPRLGETSEPISREADPGTAKTKVKENEEKLARELDEVEAINVEMDNVARFQKQQKMIEEANRQKKEYLAKAISERRKKAKAESEKLVKIQSELSHLDSLLSVDVNMIRDKIEKASFDYMDAQRRYARAEEEFINAKMALFEKGEMKEKLTEHLYTIIHQNEVRKSKKLAELMKQLEMEVAREEEEEICVPVIPMLTNFNSVTTLHDPKSPVHSPEHGKIMNLTENHNAGQVNQNVSLDPKTSVDVKTESVETNNNKLQTGADNSDEKSEKTDSSITEADNDVTSGAKGVNNTNVTEDKISTDNESKSNNANESISGGNPAKGTDDSDKPVV